MGLGNREACGRTLYVVKYSVMQSHPVSTASSAAIWIGAALTSALGATILFDAWPGINWGIWVAAASGAVILARTRSGNPVDAPAIILLAWATVLALGLAVTDNGFFHFLIIISDAMLLGLAVVVTGTSAWNSLSVRLLPTVPFLAPLRVWVASAREFATVPKSISSPRARTIVRGLLLTLPIVIALIALLRNADPVIAWSVDRITDLLPNWSISTRVLFFFFLLSLTLGANSISARQREPRIPTLPGLTLTPTTIGVTEQKMVLFSVSVILWIFVLLQVSYLFHSPPNAIGSGVTFAEYARRGFAELSFAVTIVGGVILLLETTRARDLDSLSRTSLTRLEAALLIALELVLISAFRRVILYEQAYGFTTTRLYAQAYMIVMGLALVALRPEIGKGAISINFGRRLSVIALGVFTLLVFWNHETWILNRNIDRSLVSGEFDAYYPMSLSRDVAPTLIARRQELPTKERRIVESWLECAPLREHTRWFEWNRSVAATTRALSAASLARCKTGRRIYWNAGID